MPRTLALSFLELIFGKTAIYLSDVEQILEKAQTKAIGLAIHAFQERMNGGLLGLLTDEILQPLNLTRTKW